ncbi:RHS repeat-associated core domain-containing protein [Pseudomonas purpurea]|uniref:RHS repeat domain-containing protein n=1 Tax=Pseudomonas purpurea TaxID=3136737 RepID=UPI00326694E5
MTVQVSHHTATPTLSVTDPRGLAIRSVGYCRQRVEQAMDARITRQRFDAAGRLIASWDPRLWGMAPRPNLATAYGLTGKSLLTDSVDAGWQLSLADETGSVCSVWNSRGSQRHIRFDGQVRPTEVKEWTVEERPCVVERLTYADASEQNAVHNQCGQLTRHDDPAGTQRFPEYAINGQTLSEQRQFLLSLDRPDWLPDSNARDALLEKRCYISTQVYTASGEVQRQTDAMDNTRVFTHTLAGHLKTVRLQLADSSASPRLLLSNIRYNVFGQVESEVAGNGVKTFVQYASDDGRLTRLRLCDPVGKPFQDLYYDYDPVGNIRRIEDRAQSVRYFKNQEIEPVSSFHYDSLYQLVEASGREVNTPSYGPALPVMQPSPLDPDQLRRYSQTFDYDRAGNLQGRHHSGTHTFAMFTSSNSNRSLARHEDGSLPDEQEIFNGFDACGNQRQLLRGQAMNWDARNQLREVTLVARGDGPPDVEQYAYDRPGHRLRKVRLTQTRSRTLLGEVRYLPGLEVYCNTANDEERHVISVEAGRSSVRVLHWPGERPKGLSNNLVRFNFRDHLGSSSLELDEDAGVLSQESYYPFGGTAWWVGKNATEATYRTIRYSGKERDATGLYYYGYRYYAPWLQRWVSPDPAGNVDGPNLYQMVGNNPLNYYDGQGTLKIPLDIFIADIVNPVAKTIGTGWFEELVWDNKRSTFVSAGSVFGRGMKVFEGENPEWYPSPFGHAIALFRDQNSKLRLFANMYFQHMGMQPDMGLPEFAGRLKVDQHDSSKFIIDNHSGHYKPESSIDVASMIREFAPGQQSVSYVPVPESASFESTLRSNIASPEEYSRLVNAFKHDFPGLIGYLKEQGVWDAAKERWGSNEGMNVIFKMDATGLTAEQIYRNEAESKRAERLAEPMRPTASAARAEQPLPPARSTRPSIFRSCFAGR